MLAGVIMLGLYDDVGNFNRLASHGGFFFIALFLARSEPQHFQFVKQGESNHRARTVFIPTKFAVANRLSVAANSPVSAVIGLCEHMLA